MTTDYIFVDKNTGHYFCRELERDMGSTYYRWNKTEDVLKATGMNSLVGANNLIGGVRSYSGNWLIAPEYDLRDAVVKVRRTKVEVSDA